MLKGGGPRSGGGIPFTERRRNIIYTYEYERIHVYTGRVQWATNKSETKGQREIINRRAKDGWRYVGCIPAVQMGTGTVVEMDLVFEKELP